MDPKSQLVAVLRRPSTLVVLLVAVVVLVFVTRERDGAGTNYTIMFDAASNSDSFAVGAEYRLPAGIDSLHLASYLQNEIMDLGIVEVTDARGVPLPHRVFTSSRKQLSETFTFSHVLIAVPDDRRVRVRYRASLGLKEGDPHLTGYSGGYYGKMTLRWAVASLAHMLLIPVPADLLGRVDIEYDLPDDWKVTGVAYEGKLPSGGRDERIKTKDLLFTPLALGAWHVFDHPELALKIAIPRLEVQEVAAEKLAMDAHRVFQAVSVLFQVVPQDPYLLVLTPIDSSGFDVFVEPTRHGSVGCYSGDQLVHTERLTRRAIERVVGTAGSYAGLVSNMDSWLLGGIVDHYTRVVPRRLFHDPGLLDASPALSDYLSMLIDAGDTPLVGSSVGNTELRSVKARAVVESLDLLIRSQTNSTDSLDTLLPRLRGIDQFASVPELLEDHYGRDFSDFFERYVEATEPLPFASVQHARASPASELRRPVVRDSVALLVMYDANAHLENCGCKANQWGGIARTATWMRRFREGFDGPVFALSTGSAFPMDKLNSNLDAMRSRELQLYLTLMGRSGFDCAVVGSSELYYGPAVLKDHVAAQTIPFVSTNTELGDSQPIQPFFVVEDRDARMAVIGITPREDHVLYKRLWEARTSGVEFRDATQSVKRAMTSLKERDVGLFALCGDLAPATIREILGQNPAIDVIVSQNMACKCVAEDGTLHLYDRSGFVGGTAVLYAQAGKYGVSVFTLYRDGDGRIVDFRESHEFMTEAIEDEPSVRSAIDDFYMSVGAEMGADATPSQLWAKETSAGSTYVGAEVCGGCHEAEYAQWLDTPHAAAFKPLLEQHRQYSAECVRCHVTGFAQSTGYEFGDMNSPLMHVQCETCHGPGAEHVSSQAARDIHPSPAGALCTSCHDEKHSEMSAENSTRYFQSIAH